MGLVEFILDSGPSGPGWTSRVRPRPASPVSALPKQKLGGDSGMPAVDKHPGSGLEEVFSLFQVALVGILEILGWDTPSPSGLPLAFCSPFHFSTVQACRSLQNGAWAATARSRLCVRMLSSAASQCSSNLKLALSARSCCWFYGVCEGEKKKKLRVTPPLCFLLTNQSPVGVCGTPRWSRNTRAAGNPNSEGRSLVGGQQ